MIRFCVIEIPSAVDFVNPLWGESVAPCPGERWRVRRPSAGPSPEWSPEEERDWRGAGWIWGGGAGWSPDLSNFKKSKWSKLTNYGVSFEKQADGWAWMGIGKGRGGERDGSPFNHRQLYSSLQKNPRARWAETHFLSHVFRILEF